MFKKREKIGQRKTLINVKVPEWLKVKIESTSLDAGMTVSEWIRRNLYADCKYPRHKRKTNK